MFYHEYYVFMRSFDGNGVLVCSIDNMPTQLPRESTEFFGSLLMPHIDEMVAFIFIFCCIVWQCEPLNAGFQVDALSCFCSFF